MIKSLLRKGMLLCLFSGLFTFTNAQPLSGNYTINSAVVTGGTNFQSFTNAASSLNLNGVSGAVNITVAPGSGPYNERVVFDSIQGTSATNMITLDGSGETLTALTDSANRSLLRLKGMSYFTLTNLNLVRDSTSASGFYGVQLLNYGYNIVVQNCRIDMTGSVSTLVGGIIASGSETSILDEGNFHDCVFRYDTTIGGGYGVSVVGSGSNLGANIIISDNYVYDFHTNGIHIRETDGTMISRNHLDKRTEAVTSVNAIQVSQGGNINASIFDNYIKVSQTNNGTMTFRGIYLFDGTGHKVYNNVIYDIHLTSGNFTAIEVRTDSTAPEISFNTISIDNPVSTTGDLLGFTETLSNTHSKLRSNMINITQVTSGIAVCMMLATNSSLTGAINSDFNDLYVPNGYVGGKNNIPNPTVYPSITGWRSLTNQEQHGVSMDPMFTMPSLPIPTNIALDNAGVMSATITVDILGNLRSIPPDIGAYEFLQVSVDENEYATSVVAYPNPVKSFLTFQLPSIVTNVKINIYNSLSQLVSQKVINDVNNDKVEINVEDLHQGIYFMEITSDGKRFTSEFIK